MRCPVSDYISILLSYDFLVVAAGTTILALASAIVGCFSVYKGQSLIGDAVGHATYPGIVLAYMLFQTRNPMILMLGAIVLGTLAYMTIHFMVKNSKIRLDAGLAVVLTGFFGLGMVLKSYVQGHPEYVSAAQAGLKNYIFGLAAFIVIDDVKTIALFSTIVLAVVFLFYKELVASIFDREYSQLIGINVKLMDRILLFLMIVTISIGLKTVGAVLISSFLIIPCLCANQHTRNIKAVLPIAAVVGVFSSFLGTYLSTVVKGLSTGPVIILVMGTITLISMVFGRYGVVRRMVNKNV